MRFTPRRTDLRSGLPFLGAGLACALAVLAFSHVVDTSALENTQYDQLYRRIRREVPVDSRLVLFEVDDRALEAYGFPIDRAHHAELLQGLAAVEAKGTVWDFMFMGVQPSDAKLVEAMKSLPTYLALGAQRTDTGGPPVTALQLPKFRVGLLPQWKVEETESSIQSNDEILAAAAGGGHVLPSVDADGVCRRIPPVVMLDGQYVPALGVRAALAVLGIEPSAVSLESGELVLGEGDAAIRVPLDAKGKVLLDFPRTWRDSGLDFRDYASQLESLSEPEGREALADDLRGRLVFVGYIGAAASDYVAVPWTGIEAGARSLEPGVMVSVALANAILTKSFLRVAPGWVWSAAVLVSPLLVALAWWRLRPLAASLVTAGILVALPLLSIALFAGARTFLPVAGPFVAAAASGAILTVVSLSREQARATRIAGVLSRFVSPALLKELEEVALRDRLPPARRAELSVLFIDVAGFTAFTEGQEPETLSAFLDRFYELAMEELFKQGGTLEKFMGDGLLAYFGAPNPLPEKERCAIAAAIAIRDRFAALDAERVSRGGAPLAIRCGIATGWVAVGYFGGGNRGTYGVIGRSVNLAARIQGHAEPGGILVDRATAARLDGVVATRALEPIQLKGIGKPVEIFAVAPPGKAPGEASTG